MHFRLNNQQNLPLFGSMRSNVFYLRRTPFIGFLRAEQTSFSITSELFDLLHSNIKSLASFLPSLSNRACSNQRKRLFPPSLREVFKGIFNYFITTVSLRRDLMSWFEAFLISAVCLRAPLNDVVVLYGCRLIIFNDTSKIRLVIKSLSEKMQRSTP